MSKQPSVEHQYTCNQAANRLTNWSEATGAGVVLPAPGVIFAEDDNVAPDVIWVSTERLARIVGADRKLHAAPELVVEVLSPGATNERRDREAKLRLYARQGVEEYWLVDEPGRQVEIYRRDPDAQTLRHMATIGSSDRLESPLLPGFRVQVGQLFFPR